MRQRILCAVLVLLVALSASAQPRQEQYLGSPNVLLRDRSRTTFDSTATFLDSVYLKALAGVGIRPLSVDPKGRIVVGGDVAAHTHGVANALGAQQFAVGVNESISFEGQGNVSVAFNAATKKVIISGTSGSGADGNNYVSAASFNGTTLTLQRSGLPDLTVTIPVGGTESDPVWAAAAGNYYTKGNLQTSGQAAVHWGNVTNAPAFLTSFTESDPVWVADKIFYYTRTNLQTSGQAQVHWGNITNAPAFLTSFTEADPTVSALIKNMPVSADATTNKYYYWNNGSIGRKQIAYADLSGAPNLSVYQTVANLSTAAALGTSNTLYPSQGAVKTYVDGALGSYYTRTNLQTSGQAQVHWGNITNAPAFLTSFTESDPVWAAAAGNYYTKANLQTSGGSIVHWNNVTNAPAFLTSFTEVDPKRVTAAAVSGTTNKTLTLTQADGATVTATWTDAVGEVGAGDGNDYVTGATFAGGTLALQRSGGMADVTVSLDGRYALSGHSHATPTLAQVAAAGSTTTHSLSTGGLAVTGQGASGLTYPLRIFQSDASTEVFSVRDNGNTAIAGKLAVGLSSGNYPAALTVTSGYQNWSEGILRVVVTGAAATEANLLQLAAPNMGAGGGVQLTLGRDESAGNMGFMNFYYVGNAHPDNRYSWSIFGNSDIFAMHYDSRVKMKALAGTGTRMVVADANGFVGTQAIPAGYTFTGTAAQYTRGDGTYAAFPTAVSSFANDAGYLTSFTEVDPKRVTAIAVTGDGTKTVTLTHADATTTTTTFVDNNSGGGGASYSFQHSLVNNAGTVNLVGDVASPGNSKYYGTNASGTKGFYDLPAGGGGSSNWTVSGSDVYRNSKVGIGSAPTTAWLEIKYSGTATEGIHLINNHASKGVAMRIGQNATTKQLFFGYYGSGEPAYRALLSNSAYVASGTAAESLAFTTSGTNKPIIFTTDDWIERARITGDGASGIFHIKGSGATSATKSIRTFQSDGLTETFSVKDNGDVTAKGMLKLTNYAGSGLRQLVVMADGTVGTSDFVTAKRFGQLDEDMEADQDRLFSGAGFGFTMENMGNYLVKSEAEIRLNSSGPDAESYLYMTPTEVTILAGQELRLESGGNIVFPDMDDASGTAKMLTVTNGVLGIEDIPTGNGGTASLQEVTAVGNTTTFGATFGNTVVSNGFNITSGGSSVSLRTNGAAGSHIAYFKVTNNTNSPETVAYESDLRKYPDFVTSASTVTPTTVGMQYNVNALAENATVAAPAGTPYDSQPLLLRITDNGTSRTLTWNAVYRAGADFTLPTATVAGKTMYIQLTYNAAASKWDVVGISKGY